MAGAVLVLAAVWLAVSGGAAAQAQAQAPALADSTPIATNASDVEALYALRASLKHLPNDWAQPDPCGVPTCGPMLATQCAWTGLACNASRAVAVWLPCMRDWCWSLEGTLPGALAGASELQLLEFQGNRIRGSLPPEWGGLAKLSVLSAGYNALTGKLPGSYAGMAALEHLRLSGNALTGPLPPAWGGLARLREVSVAENGLQGGFPANWSQLAAMQVLVFEGNTLSGSLPGSWVALYQLQVLDVRGMCAVCGPVPFTQSVRLGLSGSSLGWPCGSGNCGGLPLGFLGQAVIISAILLVLMALCMWRRVWMFRRHGRDGQRSGMGLLRAAVSGRMPRPPLDPGLDRDEYDVEANAGPAAPPVVVLQPDQALCTARMDADWAAALAAAQAADGGLPKPPDPTQPQQQASAAAGEQTQRRWWRAAWWRRGQRSVSGAPEPAAGAPEAGRSVEMAAAVQLQQAAQQAGAAALLQGSATARSSSSGSSSVGAASAAGAPLAPAPTRSRSGGSVRAASTAGASLALAPAQSRSGSSSVGAAGAAGAPPALAPARSRSGSAERLGSSGRPFGSTRVTAAMLASAAASPRAPPHARASRDQALDFIAATRPPSAEQRLAAERRERQRSRRVIPLYGVELPPPDGADGEGPQLGGGPQDAPQPGGGPQDAPQPGGGPQDAPQPGGREAAAPGAAGASPSRLPGGGPPPPPVV